MASGSFGPYPSTGTQGSFYQGRLVITATPDSDAKKNRSLVTWSFQIWANGSSQYGYSNGNQVRIIINGSYVVNTGNIGRVELGGTSSSNPRVLSSGSVYVGHNNDGTKTLTVSAVYQQDSASYLKSITVPNSNLVLDKIIRAATIDLSPDITIPSFGNTNHTVTWTDVENYYYKVQYIYGNTILHTSEAIQPDVEEYTWAVPPSVASNETNAKLMRVTVALHTYTDSTCTNELGSNSKQFVINFGNGFGPSIMHAIGTWEDTIDTNVVCGLSYIEYEWETWYTQNATFSEGYAVYVDSNGNEVGQRVYTNTSSVTLPPLPSFSETTKEFGVRISETDSRGFTTILNTGTTSVYGWTTPSITDISASRCDNDGTENDRGLYYKTTLTYTIRSIGGTSANPTNAKNVKIKYRWNSEQNFTQSASVTLPDYSGTVTLGPYQLANPQDDKLWVRTEVSDSLSSQNPAVATFTVLPADVFIDIMTEGTRFDRKNGLAIGRASTKTDTVQIAWDFELCDKTFTIVDDDGVVRVSLDFTNGLRFFDANGDLLSSYPVTGI